MPVRVKVLRTLYSLLPKKEVHELLIGRAEAGGSGYVCVWNVHTTMMSYFDPDYERIGNESLLTVPDGLPIVWAMNLLRDSGTERQDRVRGPSLMREICEAGLKFGAKHYLYGGSPKALEELQKVLKESYSGIRIVGAESPPFRTLTQEEMQKAADRINVSGAHFLWVGLGAPKQERWMYAQKDKIRPIMLGVGAAFDLIPGLIPEAPSWMQTLGLEWFYRFCKEPRRLWRRYLFNNPAFIVLLLGQWMRQKLLGNH